MARILLMEDEVDQAVMLSLIIEKRGHQVDIAASADEAIAKADATAYDLVITDLFVQQKGVQVGSGGLRLIGFLRNGTRTGPVATERSVPIIAMSGVLGGPSEGHFLKIAETTGANIRLEKPVPPQKLHAAIDDLLKG
ncbi:response regulator [Pseudooceanicola sp. CBS1P-1]|uniref:Response regulator n=1 Tax=Pseudooceanicola albus TaxID=2692189 RepID=A0A6L7G1Z3_9RHOB|nr:MULTISPECIES: response regulator [Pseudooceanicola]MBT9384975.1 response regulator [Pseudooceanicola endophyticus]MXN18031.1 response regulator [Pseudooceanicola albus]